MYHKLTVILLLVVQIEFGTSTCKKKPVISGNTVTFSPIQINVPSSNLPTSYDAKGLQPFFNLANSFMNTVQSKSVGKELRDVIKEIEDNGINGVFDNDVHKDKLIKYETPIAVAVGFGLLFALLMPLVGLCFCCCRCCGKCGGKMYQDSKSSTKHTLCCVMAFVHLIVVIFMLCGVLFMFVTNNRFHDTTADLESNYNMAVKDVVQLANTTIETGLFIPNEFIPCVIDLVLDDVSRNGITLHIGNPLQSFVEKNVSSVLSAALTESNNVVVLRDSLTDIISLKNNLVSSASTLTTELDTIKTELQNVVAECRGTAVPTAQCDNLDAYKNLLSVTIDFSSLPDVTTERSKIQDIVDKNLTGFIQKAQGVVVDIPNTVVTKSQSARDDVEKVTRDLPNEIRQEVDKVTDDIRKEIIDKESELIGYGKDYFGTASDYFKYEDYRWYGYIGLSSVVAFIVVLMALGLTFGTCGYRKDRLPSNRSSTATCGGNCLMAAVGFMFMFSFFLMMFCVIWYVVGIHFFIMCRDMENGELIDDLQLKSLTWNGKFISVKDAITNCRNDIALYTALNGDKYYNLTEHLDVKQHTKDIEKKVDEINFDLSDQTILSQETKDSLNELINSGVDDLNFTEFFVTLREKITAANLTEVSQNLSTIANNVEGLDASLANSIRNLKVNIENVESGTIVSIKNQVNYMESNVTETQAKATNLKAKTADLLNNLTASENFVQVGATTFIKDQIKLLSNRIIGWLDQATDFLNNEVRTNLMRCKPISNLYDGFLNTLVCDNVVQNANGFWLALGWCMLFFVPAIILSVKLAKFFRKMSYDSGYDNEITHPPYNDKIPLQNYDHHPPPPYENTGYAHQ